MRRKEAASAAVGFGALAWCALAVATVAAREPSASPVPATAGPCASQPAPLICNCCTPHEIPLTLDRLACMSWDDLEQLYRQSEAGTVWNGYACGRAIYCPDQHFAGLRSKVTRLLWHGKIYHAEDCTLINQWCGFRAIRAKVYYGPSWLDGKPSIIMDYSETSHVWADVRDEVREVAPGLFLGVMYLRKCPPHLKMYFALEAACPCQ